MSFAFSDKQFLQGYIQILYQLEMKPDTRRQECGLEPFTAAKTMATGHFLSSVQSQKSVMQLKASTRSLASTESRGL